MIRKLSNLVAITILAVLLEQFLPWWSLMLASFAVSFLSDCKRQCLFLGALFGRCIALVGTFLFARKCKRLCVDQQNGCFVPFARKCCAAFARLKLCWRACSGSFRSVWQRMQASFGQKVLKKRPATGSFSKSISTRS